MPQIPVYPNPVARGHTFLIWNEMGDILGRNRGQIVVLTPYIQSFQPSVNPVQRTSLISLGDFF